jgi:hypothetical protein
MASRPVAPGAPFAFEMSIRALDEQLRRIEALDSKSGILLAAVGVVIGLLLSAGSAVARFPQVVAISATISLILSLLLGLIAFANRRYEFAPKPEAVIRLMAAGSDWIQWRLLGNLTAALATNRRKLAWKARFLTSALVALIVAVGTLGGYFIYQLATPPLWS